MKIAHVITATDYVGEYTKYVFVDGHTETNPPGRPLSKEDVQRKRRKELSVSNAMTMLSASGDNNSGGITDEIFTSHEKLSTAAETLGAKQDDVDYLLRSVEVGGDLVTWAG